MEMAEQDLIKNAFDEGWQLGRQEAIHDLEKLQAAELEAWHESLQPVDKIIQVDEEYERMLSDFGPEDGE